jgi:zinc protease
MSNSTASLADLKFPPLNPIRMPEAVRHVLKCGMVVYLLRDSRLPLVDWELLAGAGSIWDPKDKHGLAELGAEVMRIGGTEEYPANAIDDFLEGNAAKIEFETNRTYTAVTGTALSEQFGKVFGVFMDLLANPLFPQDKLEFEKVQHLSAIARRNDEPFEIARREMRKLIYDAASPYAAFSDPADIEAIELDDLRAWHQATFWPGNFILGVWGDFEEAPLLAILEELTASWPVPAGEKPVRPALAPEGPGGAYLVTQSHLNQSTILMGHRGGMRNDPDFFALAVLNRVLSEGFTSRLFSNVRSAKGLAYSVFGQWAALFDYPGFFYAGCVTQTTRTAEAIQAILFEIERLQKEEISKDELFTARESYFNSFVFNFEDTSKIVGRLLIFEYAGYPIDFLEHAKESVEKVTIADVRRVAETHLRLPDLKIVIVGEVKADDPQLKPFLPVRELDITIPDQSE